MRHGSIGAAAPGPEARYAFARAASNVGPSATTLSTRPPFVTSSPAALRAVPAWNTVTPSSRSASSMPVMTLPFSYDPG